MARRKGLGKGLEALLSNDRQTETEIDLSDNGMIQMLSVDLVKARSDQPRQEFDEAAIQELSESIQRYGILQPLVATEKDGVYTLIAGERRLRAAKQAGLREVPVIIREATPQEIAEISLVENIQREDLNAVEEAQAYEELMSLYGYTQAELSQRIGKSRSYIANSVRLLKLDEVSLYYLKRGEITSSQARSLLALTKESDRRALIDKILAKSTNVRHLEKVARRAKQKDLYEEDAENALMERLGTKVQIIPRKKGGKIEVEYYSTEDLERIIGLLSGEEEESTC